VAEAEILSHLLRAGHPVTPADDSPGPWAASLAGDHATAAMQWIELGERYEAAIELHLTGDPDERERASAVLHDLGATATIAALER
jgi:hypothetical protein